MLNAIVRIFNRIFPNVGFLVSRRWFEYISTRESGQHLLFMNYGYNAEDPGHLLEVDEEHRYSIQLYHHVAGAIDLADLSVLEVGCGRGGGASYVKRYLEPNTVVAVDLTASAIAFCNDYYEVPGLTFEKDDAQAMQFSDCSFDALLNIESSICYQYPELFFAEVFRVLKPGGYFLYADIRSQEELPEWSQQLAATGLDKLEEEDITARVVEALDLDNERRRRLINQFVPRLLRHAFKEFAGVQGSDFFYSPFMRREKVYRRYLFQKPLT